MRAAVTVSQKLFRNWEEGVSSVAFTWSWLTFAFLQRQEPDPEYVAAPERDKRPLLSSKEKAMQPGLELRSLE